MKLPCKTGEYEVPNAVLEAYAALHPTADQEFAKMVIWLENNRSRRPASPKSAPRFVSAWFKRVPKRVAEKPKSERAQTVGQLLHYVPRQVTVAPTWVHEQPPSPLLPWYQQ